MPSSELPDEVVSALRELTMALVTHTRITSIEIKLSNLRRHDGFIQPHVRIFAAMDKE